MQLSVLCQQMSFNSSKDTVNLHNYPLNKMGEVDSIFLKTFKILPEYFDAGAYGKVYKASIRARMGPIGPLHEGDICVVKQVEPSEKTTVDDSYRKEVHYLLLTEGLGHLLGFKGGYENIVRYYHHWIERPIGKPDGILFIAMEYCDLGSLEQFLCNKDIPRSYEDTILLVYQIAQGLRFLHQRCIVHRDLKPSNILLKSGISDLQKGVVVAKIADFGLATGDQQLLDSTSVIGTPYYISPEMMSRKGNCTEKVDIFAMGIIFCQLLVDLFCELEKTKLMDIFSTYMNGKINSWQAFDPQEYFSKFELDDEKFSLNINLANAMSSVPPENRPSAATICTVLHKKLPNIDDLNIPSAKYMRHPNVHRQVAFEHKFREIRPIGLDRLEIMTHLTLRNVYSTDDELIKILKHTTNLVSLSLAVQFTNPQHDKIDGKWNGISLPHLRSFLYHEIIKTYLFQQFIDNMKQNEEQLYTNILFFGPIEQILLNKMRIKVEYSSYTLVDIDFKNSKFELDGACAAKLCQILQNATFRRISLKNLINLPRDRYFEFKTREDVYLSSNVGIEWTPGFQSDCESLELYNFPVNDLREGEIFKHFHNLRELRYYCGLDKKSTEILRMKNIPRTIRKLYLAYVSLDFASMRETEINDTWKLEELHFNECHFDKDFHDIYLETFEVEDLILVQGNMTKTYYDSPYKDRMFIPNCRFVSLVVSRDKASWNSMRFDAIDWSSKLEDDEAVKATIMKINEAMRLDRVPVGQQCIQMINLKDGNLRLVKLTEIEIHHAFLSPQNRGNESDDEDIDSDDEDAIDKQNPIPATECYVMMVHPGIGDVAELDDTLEENYSFKSPEPGPLQDFRRFPRSVSLKKLKNVHISRCTINGSTLANLLRACINLETLTLELIQLREHIRIPMVLPKLTSYIFHLDSNDSTNLEDLFSDIEKVKWLFFFRGLSFLKRLWKAHLNVRISKIRTKYLLIDHKQKKLLMENLTNAADIFTEIADSDDDIEAFTLNQCCFTSRLLPQNVTYLNLRLVEDLLFMDVFDPPNRFPNLKHLLYESKGRRLKQKVDLEKIKDSLKSLETLSLSGIVTISSLTKLKLKSVSLMGNMYFPLFEEQYPEYFDVETINFVGHALYQPFFRTLYHLITNPKASVKSAHFMSFALDGKVISPLTSSRLFGKEKDILQRELKFCEDFLERHGILEEESNYLWMMGFRVFRDTQGEWKAERTERADKVIRIQDLMQQEELTNYP